MAALLGSRLRVVTSVFSRTPRALVAASLFAGGSAHAADAVDPAPVNTETPPAPPPAPPPVATTPVTPPPEPASPVATTPVAVEASTTPRKSADGTDTSVAPKALYFSGELGIVRSDLGAISNKTAFDRTGANGGLYGLAAGVRLRNMLLGLRWRVQDTTDFTLWSFALSAGYALPMRPITPILSAHVGYVFDSGIDGAVIRGSLPSATVIPPQVSVRGLLAGLDVNANYWLTPAFRLGVFLGGDVMFLHRDQASVPRLLSGGPADVANEPLFSGTGSGIGVNVSVGLRGAFDIAFR